MSLTVLGSRSQKGAEPEVSLSRARIPDPELYNAPLRREVMGREGLTAGHHTESHQIRHIFPTSPHSQLCLKEPLHMLRALISNRKERACLSQPGEVHRLKPWQPPPAHVGTASPPHVQAHRKNGLVLIPPFCHSPLCVA